MNLQVFTKWYAKYVLFALCCIILLVVPLLKGTWVGSEPFLYFRLAQGPSWFDPLSAGGQFAAYQWGTPLVLSPAPEILIQILPFLFGILSFILLGKILRHFSNDEVFIHLSLLLFILSPTFIYTFSFTNSLFIAFFLSLAAFFFFIQKKRKWYSLPILFILPLFNLFIACTLLLILFLYSFLWKEERKKLFSLLFLSSILSATLYYGYIFYNTGLPQTVNFEAQNQFVFFQKFFFDLGSPYGLGIFIGILAIVGIASLWDKKYSNLFFFFSTISLFFLSFFLPESLLFLSLFLLFLASKGFLHLLSVEWSSIQYKKFILLIILSGLTFSAISQMNHLIESSPDDAALEGLAFLAKQDAGVVFTDYTRGIWVSAAGHKNVLDKNYIFVSDAQERFVDSQELFYSRDLEKTKELFEKYDISYVWVDAEMKEKIWEYDTEGLLFILQYTKSFKKIYDKNGIEIWRIEQ